MIVQPLEETVNVLEKNQNNPASLLFFYYFTSFKQLDRFNEMLHLKLEPMKQRTVCPRNIELFYLIEKNVHCTKNWLISKRIGSQCDNTDGEIEKKEVIQKKNDENFSEKKRLSVK